MRRTPNRSDSLIPLAILTASAGALGVAYTAQYVFGLEPCILCIYQRLPYVTAGLLSILALGLRPGTARAVAVALCALAFLVGAGIAFYHVGVEQHWWQSATGCGGGQPAEITMEQMMRELTSKPPKPCDQVDWTLFGISMATYNVAGSLFLAAAALAGATRLKAQLKD